MATALIRVINIKNIGTQMVPIHVASNVSSPITTFSGTMQLQPGAAFTAEDNRFDIAQLRSMANKKLISFEQTRQSVTTTDSGSGSGT